MSLSEKNIREKQFHNALQSQPKERFENIFYKAIYKLNEDFFKYLEKNVKNSEVLDYGCGVGTSIEKVIKYNPKKIFGIDISEVSIEKAKKRAEKISANVFYQVDNCENTKFSDSTFDIVYGTGILHHLQFNKCLDEIFRILKSKGTLIFIEPLGTNPIINLYRKLTPKSRSEDEHPLLEKDIEYIKNKFSELKVNYYGFATLVFFPFYKNPQSSKVYKMLCKLDDFLFKFKFFKLFAWSILITAKKN